MQSSLLYLLKHNFVRNLSAVKKFFALFILLAALGIVGYIYFDTEAQRSSSKALYRSIPEQFPIAIEAGNWSMLLDRVDSFSYIQAMNEQDWLIGMRVNLNDLKALNDLLLNSKLPTKMGSTLFAFGNAGNSQLGILAATDVPDELGLEDILAVLNQENINYSISVFEQQEIVSIESGNESFDLTGSLTIKNQILLYSHQGSFIEEALLQLNKVTDEWLPIDQELGEIQDIKMYLKPAQLPYLTSYLFKPEGAPLMDLFKQLTGPSALEFNLFQEAIHYNGFTRYDSMQLLGQMQAFSPASIQVLNELPSNTAQYTCIGIKDNTTHFNQDFALKRLHAIIDETLVLFTLESYDENLANRRAGMITLREDDCFSVLRELDASVAISDTLYDMPVYQSKLGQLLNKAGYQEDFFSDVLYFYRSQNYLLFSSELATLQQAIQAQQDGRVLRTKDSYTDFSASFASQANASYYLDLSLIQPYLTSKTTTNSWQTLYGQVASQFSHLGDLCFVSGKLAFQEAEVGISKELWSVQLDTLAAIAPQLLVNHNTNNKEILIQDLNNNLYLIEASGRVLWKVGLEGQIQGDIQQIDYYTNKKLQYVFNTANKIYVVDRTGELVDGFPISLPSQALGGMLLINYDNLGKYRYMVACDNGNIYAYEKNGSPLAGWSPKRDVGMVSTPINHVLHAGKDYIYFKNDDGVFYALNRKGENRFAPVQTVNFSTPFYFIDGAFLGGDAGMVETVNTLGDLTSKTLLDSTYRQCLPARSLLQGEQGYAFVKGNTFTFQQSQWENFSSYTTADSIQGMESFVYQDKRWFVLTTESQSYLIDEIGNLHPDFPVNSTLVRFVNLIPGKQQLMVYPDPQGRLRTIEIGWTNL